MAFGFLDISLNLNNTHFKIAPRGDINTAGVRKLADDEGWITAPSIKKRLFSLPLNYQLDGNFNNKENARCFISCLGFLLGVKLATLQNEFLDATKLRSTFGFMLVSHSDLEKALTSCYNEILSNCPENNNRIFTIIHLLFMSSNKYYLPFEKFTYSYMAIDCCYRFINKKFKITAKNHPLRMEAIAKWAGVKLPIDTTKITKTRGNLFHEGLYENAPLGYSFFKYNLHFLNNFLCKILFRILNINDNNFISCVPCETLDIIGITIA